MDVDGSAESLSLCVSVSQKGGRGGGAGDDGPDSEW